MEGFNGEQLKQLRGIVTEVVQPIQETLDARMERGFAALADDIAEARAETAALRDQLAEFRTETHENFASLRAEIHDIRQRLESLEEAGRNSAGFTKEIDHLMERVVDIEKHLGIQHKIAA